MKFIRIITMIVAGLIVGGCHDDHKIKGTYSSKDGWVEIARSGDDVIVIANTKTISVVKTTSGHDAVELIVAYWVDGRTHEAKNFITFEDCSAGHGIRHSETISGGHIVDSEFAFEDDTVVSNVSKFICKHAKPDGV